MQQERFDLIDGNGLTVATLADTGPLLSSFATEAILHWLRAGQEVRWCAAEQPALPAPTVETPTRHYTRRAPKSKPAAKPAKPTQPFTLHAKAYLRWSALDDDQKTHLSQYRLIAGEVVERKPGQRAVRFNGDPSIWLPIEQLSKTAYTE